ncbi:hypothetical protein [Acinetobacter sp. CFCC 10889]|uniref:hypothetical protein n=1 Tax=Acinetobacter sp. CFCC 10889 TaxID=1775557 RepID=UPI000DD057EB|nr:hypothetical protein [Acinetobacter sp. CFCC 10889]
MATLTKAEREYILKELNSQFSQVVLMCDGYRVSLALERVQDLKLAIGIYINHMMKSAWMIKPEEYPESKFLPVRKKAMYPPAKKAKIFKEFGKRRAKEFFPNLDHVFEYRGSHFSTGRAALNHILKVSESVELVGGVPSE